MVLVVPSAEMTTSSPFSLPVAISVSLAAHLPPLPPASLSSTTAVILPAGLTPPVDGSSLPNEVTPSGEVYGARREMVYRGEKDSSAAVVVTRFRPVRPVAPKMSADIVIAVAVVVVVSFCWCSEF